MPTYQFGLKTWEVQPNAMPKAHHHNDIELIYIHDGQLQYMYRAQNLHLQAGNVILFWAAIPHQLIQVIEPCTLYIVTIPLRTFLEWHLVSLNDTVMQGNPFVQMTTPSIAQLLTVYFKQWQRDLQMLSAERQTIVLLEMQSLIRRISLYQTTLTQSSKHSDSDTRTRHAQQIAGFIAQHYTEALSLQTIADVVGLHPSYVSSLFTEVFDIPLWDYLTQYRVAHAQRLLLLTTTPVQDIAVLSGFTSTSQFYAIFRKYTQQSPKKFRNTSSQSPN